MSGTIKSTIGIEHTNGALSIPVSPSTITRTQTAVMASKKVQTIGTSQESLDFDDVATPTEVYLKNIDSTNYVEIGLDVGGFQGLLRLGPGVQNSITLKPGVTVKALANTAPVGLLIAAYDA